MSLVGVLSAQTYAQEPLLLQFKNKENQYVAHSLSQTQQVIIPIAAFSAIGDLEGLNRALVYGLEQGLTVNQIKALLVQTYAYAGFPRSLNALTTFMSLLEQRQANGITDVLGTESKPLNSDYQAKIQGTENQTQLVGQAVKGPLFEFSPEIDEYLKAHLFGDIFSKNVLSWQDREIATIAMLASMHGVESQLQSHLFIATKQGITLQQFDEIEQILTEKVNLRTGVQFQKVKDVFQEKSN